MGLTKRVDYSGQVKKLKPHWVTPSNDGGPDVITRKLGIHGPEDKLKPFEVPENGLRFTEKNYINPGDPNHLHYYIWRWFSQITAGSDEVIRHAIAGETGNDIITKHNSPRGKVQYKISSYNRTKKSFTVLFYTSGADGTESLEVSIPSEIQNGKYYNNKFSRIDFRGEGFKENTRYQAIATTKEINRSTGQDEKVSIQKKNDLVVKNGKLTFRVGSIQKFSKIEFLML